MSVIFNWRPLGQILPTNATNPAHVWIPKLLKSWKKNNNWDINNYDLELFLHSIRRKYLSFQSKVLVFVQKNSVIPFN